MEIRDNDKICIITPIGPVIDSRETEKLVSYLDKEQNRKIALDLSYIFDCTIEFIDKIKLLSKTKNIGIFNVSSDIFSLFNIMGIDKTTKIFVSEQDWEDDLRRLVNRSFTLVR